MLQKEGKKKDGDKDNSKEDEDSGRCWINKWSFRLFKKYTKYVFGSLTHFKLNPL